MELNIINRIFLKIYGIFFFLLALFIRPKRNIVVFGGAPIIKFARWANALNKAQIKSVSLVPSVYSINNQNDFDYLWQDLLPKFILTRKLRRIFAPGIALFWIVNNARVVCAPVGGISFLSWAGLDILEILLFKVKKVKILVITGGGDSYMLGFIEDKALRAALQASYPVRTRTHKKIENRVRLWEQHADIYIASQMINDGFARNDLITPHMGCLPENNMVRSAVTLDKSKIFTVVHAPNHRHFKGTDFIREAIQNLCAQGFSINFLLLEGVPNHQVLDSLKIADLVVDQLVMPGYSNFTIECLSFGIPTIANIESQPFHTIMSRYSFIPECPIIHANPENIEEILRNLLTNPEKLSKLRIQSYNYFQKRHSEQSWINLWKYFEKINFDGVELSKNPYAAREYQVNLSNAME